MNNQVKELPPALWKVHTANLLEEILVNNDCNILKVPLNIFGKLLYLVGERAAELNDDKLNALMLRLTIYEIADPENPNFNSKLVEELIAKGS